MKKLLSLIILACFPLMTDAARDTNYKAAQAARSAQQSKESFRHKERLQSYASREKHQGTDRGQKNQHVRREESERINARLTTEKTVEKDRIAHLPTMDAPKHLPEKPDVDSNKVTPAESAEEALE